MQGSSGSHVLYLQAMVYPLLPACALLQPATQLPIPCGGIFIISPWLFSLLLFSTIFCCGKSSLPWFLPGVYLISSAPPSKRNISRYLLTVMSLFLFPDILFGFEEHFIHYQCSRELLGDVNGAQSKCRLNSDSIWRAFWKNKNRFSQRQFTNFTKLSTNLYLNLCHANILNWSTVLGRTNFNIVRTHSQHKTAFYLIHTQLNYLEG